MYADVRVKHPGGRSIIQVIRNVDCVDRREGVERLIARGQAMRCNPRAAVVSSSTSQA